MKALIFILVYFCLKPIFLYLETPGRLNSIYPIDDYYGSFILGSSIIISLASNLLSSFSYDSPTIIYWSRGNFMDNLTNLWIADPKEHTIKLIPYSNNKTVVYVVGKKNVKSFRNGDASNALFNTPSSLVFFNNATPFEYNRSFVYLKENYDSSCLINYTTDCSNKLNFTNPLEEDVILDINRVLFIKKKINMDPRTYQPEVFITDKMNHCIRKIDLITSQVSTYAGICTNPGFKDGPLGVNQFNQPDGIGIDDKGNLIVFDSMNNYLRIIDNTGYVRTLLNGACYEYSLENNTNFFNIKLRHLVCFMNWIKMSGKPNEHLYVESNQTKCLDNILFCPGYISNLVYSRNMSSTNLNISKNSLK